MILNKENVLPTFRVTPISNQSVRDSKARGSIKRVLKEQLFSSNDEEEEDQNEKLQSEDNETEESQESENQGNQDQEDGLDDQDEKLGNHQHEENENHNKHDAQEEFESEEGKKQNHENSAKPMFNNNSKIISPKKMAKHKSPGIVFSLLWFRFGFITHSMFNLLAMYCKGLYLMVK